MPSSITSGASRKRKTSATELPGALRRPAARRHQEERSERSRGQILEAALKLFSSRGYHGTSMRDIAVAANVSTGNVYHQFPDKETMFRTLLDRYWEAVASPDYPFNRALFEGAFPDDLEALGRAARETVERYRPYIALIYVDVVEFEGSHIRKFYSDMASRFEKFLATPAARTRTEGRMRDGVSPLSAVMLTTRFLLHYFTVEVLFGVPNHFGSDTNTVLAEISDILSYGMLAQENRSPQHQSPRSAASGSRRAARRDGM
jgi:AcrR family transcriptional regulator